METVLGHRDLPQAVASASNLTDAYKTLHTSHFSFLVAHVACMFIPEYRKILHISFRIADGFGLGESRHTNSSSKTLPQYEGLVLAHTGVGGGTTDNASCQYNSACHFIYPAPLPTKKPSLAGTLGSKCRSFYAWFSLTKCP